MAKKRNFALLLGLGTAIALAAGGGAAYWYVERRLPNAAMPVGADIVPQNALMTVSFSTDAGQWRKLRQFGTSETQAIFDQNLAQLRDRLFDLYVREPQAGFSTGNGLKLYLCRQIIEAHGGGIGALSKPKHGFKFWFTLPLPLRQS